jgi:hypothetical protein
MLAAHYYPAMLLICRYLRKHCCTLSVFLQLLLASKFGMVSICPRLLPFGQPSFQPPPLGKHAPAGWMCLLSYDLEGQVQAGPGIIPWPSCHLHSAPWGACHMSLGSTIHVSKADRRTVPLLLYAGNTTRCEWMQKSIVNVLMCIQNLQQCDPLPVLGDCR